MGLFNEFVNDDSVRVAPGKPFPSQPARPLKRAAAQAAASASLPPAQVRLIGVEAAGYGVDKGPGKHAATLTMGSPGVLHGSFSYLLQDEDGQVIEPHSISAGLDYPGIGPEHAFLKDVGRAEYFAITDAEALEAFKRVTRLEGIIPALETSHAFAYLEKLCPTLKPGTRVRACQCGRLFCQPERRSEVELTPLLRGCLSLAADRDQLLWARGQGREHRGQGARPRDVNLAGRDA